MEFDEYCHEISDLETKTKKMLVVMIDFILCLILKIFMTLISKTVHPFSSEIFRERIRNKANKTNLSSKRLGLISIYFPAISHLQRGSSHKRNELKFPALREKTWLWLASDGNNLPSPERGENDCEMERILL